MAHTPGHGGGDEADDHHDDCCGRPEAYRSTMQVHLFYFHRHKKHNLTERGGVAGGPGLTLRTRRRLERLGHSHP